MKELLQWLRDGDSMYVGARACLLRGLENSAHILAHAALERYMKGILRHQDPSSFSLRVLRGREFGHDLVALLDAASRFYSLLDDPRLHHDIEILTREFEGGRYLATADKATLTSDSHVNDLLQFMKDGRLDWSVCQVRNIALGSVPKQAQTALLLAEMSRDDIIGGRTLVTESNPAFTSFVGLG